MKKLLNFCLCLSLLCCMACESDDETVFIDKFYGYTFDAETNPLGVPAEGCQHEFSIKDEAGNKGLIVAISDIAASTDKGREEIDNMAFSETTRRVEPIATTISRDWFTVKVENNRLKVLLSPNPGSNKRKLYINIIPGLHDRDINATTAACPPLQIEQDGVTAEASAN